MRTIAKTERESGKMVRMEYNRVTIVGVVRRWNKETNKGEKLRNTNTRREKRDGKKGNGFDKDVVYDIRK